LSEHPAGFGATFEVLSAAELDRVKALYAPLTDAVRDLIDATIWTRADDDVVEDARVAIQAAARSLREKTWPAGTSFVTDGHPVPLANAAIGPCNPIAPPMVVHHEDDGRCWSEFVLGSAYEGPPGLVHGGVSALLLDHILGEAASEGMTKPRFTGTLTAKYLRGTPLGPLRAEAFVVRTEGVKTYARGHISDAAGITVEAEGVFIQPAWARESE
jgi:acyl-coenzyme A thioesterase PaaI-like protein